MPPLTFHRSSNGDDWLLLREEGSEGMMVRHRANAASGGQETLLPVQEFIQRNPGSPEVQALKAILDKGSAPDV
ncbi:hypothetical protein GCM10011390_33360 [Aureimonas endophytica]|uniref:Uncharacterized protein n=1 Tax=Aureimonas endophytica TaxID=2027858 RepID=A0A916ZSD1_9HYPH|nr:hypothetical protein [Aureimonas endophytica]GGE11560.1 hypothetical protein GCM10011390_33360 [Aureimonas endophytica]